MKAVIYILSILVSAAAWAGPAFDLETKGNQVCKKSDGESELQCFTALSQSSFQNFKVPDGIDLVKEAREEKIGAGQLSPTLRQYIVKNYRELSVRHFGVDLKNVTGEGTLVHIPFVMSVRWKGQAAMEGTLQTEGVLSLNADITSEQEMISQLSTMLEYKEFFDSSTEARIPWLRGLETAARSTHFTVIYGTGLSTEAATLELLNKVVGPATMLRAYSQALAPSQNSKP